MDIFRVTPPYRSGTRNIEDVERGAELSFSGPLRGPPSRPLRGPSIIVKFCFQTTKFWFQTDGRTDGRTDAINIFWAFLVKNYSRFL